MATYFAGNTGILGGEDGGGRGGGVGGGLHTMVLMNPTTYVHFNSVARQDPPPSSSSAAAGNFLLFNPSAAAGSLLASPHAPPQHFQDEDSSNNNVSGVLHGFIPRVYGTPVEAARETPRAQRELSLSLPSVGAASGMQGLVLSSKYLKAAQELLDEVACVTNNNTTSTENHNSNRSLVSKKSCDDVDNENAAAGESTGGDKTSGKVVSAEERQEIQMKRAKLVTMLDEVDQRYKQYNNQMKTVVTSLEHVAGSGSAKRYTSLALKTISKQFRSLKDAVVAHIKAVNKSLGEEYQNEAKKMGGGGSHSSSRLRWVDHHLRQQRALQQLGVMQHHLNNSSNSNGWRPQRGLPERAVSVLRAWLFEHFLHPYPKDSDKIMLAKQTGLTRSQVSNWFINARVRLWKPMVEEMYLEEAKGQDKNNVSPNKNANSNQDSTSKTVGYRDHKPEKSPVSESPQNNSMNNRHHCITTMSTSIPVTASEFEGSLKRLRTNELLDSPTSFPSANKAGDSSISPKFRDEKEFPFVASNRDFTVGFGAYSIGETERFETEQFAPSYPGSSSNNGVSLTLGLPRCESFVVSPATHQNMFTDEQSSIQLGRPVEMMSEPAEFGVITTSAAAAYNTISLQNQRRFAAAAAQLLPDFVT